MTLAGDVLVQEPEAEAARKHEASAAHSPADNGKARKLERPSSLKFVRAQRVEEMVELRGIANEFHAESRYAHLPFSERKFIRVFEKAVREPHNTLAVYVKHHGRTVAMLNAGVGDYYLGEGGRLVTVYAMYVSGTLRHTALGGRIGLKLMRIVTDWAKSQNAVELHVHATSGIAPDRTDKFLRRLGFATYGGNYAVELG